MPYLYLFIVEAFIINDSQYNNFFFDLLKSISLKGWSRIGILKSNDTPIAYEYSVNYFGFVKQLKASFDKSYSQYSPGSLLITDGLKGFFQDKQKEKTSKGVLDQETLWKGF